MEALWLAAKRRSVAAREEGVEFPKWFRITWWVALLVTTSTFLYHRLPDLTAGGAAPIDVFVFLAWSALALVPVFQEFSFLGLKLKQQVEELGRQITSQVSSLRSEIHSRVDVSPNFYWGGVPPTDAVIPELEARIEAVVNQAMQAHLPGAAPVEVDLQPPDANTQFLFSVRYNLERELRRIWEHRFGELESRRHMAVSQIVAQLTEAQLIDPGVGRAIREVYSVCSPAVHGKPVTEIQLGLVRDVGPRLVSLLRSVL